MTLGTAQLDSVVDRGVMGEGDVLRTAHGQGNARERAAAGSGTGFTTHEAAFKKLHFGETASQKPSLRRDLRD